MDEREIGRYQAWLRCKKLSEKIMRIQLELNSVKNELRKAQSEYESLDCELMMEKRTILKPTGLPNKRRSCKKKDLTLNQVRDIADRLGIDLSKLKID